jgi:hypothetical protein
MYRHMLTIYTVIYWQYVRYILTCAGIYCHYVQVHNNIMYSYMLKFSVIDADTNLKDRHAHVLNSLTSTVSYKPCSFYKKILLIEQPLPLHCAVSITALRYLFPFIKFHLHITMKNNHKNHVIHYTPCPQFTTRAVRGSLHALSTVHYTRCPQFTTRAVHNSLHVLSTIRLTW